MRSTPASGTCSLAVVFFRTLNPPCDMQMHLGSDVTSPGACELMQHVRHLSQQEWIVRGSGQIRQLHFLSTFLIVTDIHHRDDVAPDIFLTGFSINSAHVIYISVNSSPVTRSLKPDDFSLARTIFKFVHDFYEMT